MIATLNIPGLDAPISPYVLGTMTFGDTASRDTAREMIAVARDAGVRLIDTANGYASNKTERILGELLSGDDTVALATKAGIPHPDAGDHAPLSAEGLRLSLEGSLSRLQRERIELFYLHQPDRATPIKETLAQVGSFLQEGRILAWGVSNFAAWQIADLTATARQMGIAPPLVAQQLYNLVARRIEAEYAEFALTHGLHTMVYNPLGGGLLTGRHTFDEAPTSDRFSSSLLAPMYRDRYWNEHIFAGIGQLGAVAQDTGISLTELSLRWLISQNVTSSVLLGSSKVEHLVTNLSHLEKGPLPTDVVNRCTEIGQKLDGPMPDYNR